LPLKALGSQPWFSTHFKPAIQVLIQCLLRGIQIPVAISFTQHLVQMRLCIPEPAVNGLVQVLPLFRIVRPGFHSSVAHLYLQRVVGEWQPAASGRISYVELSFQVPESDAVAEAPGVEVEPGHVRSCDVLAGVNRKTQASIGRE
jgi:hypothetical protein